MNEYISDELVGVNGKIIGNFSTWNNENVWKCNYIMDDNVRQFSIIKYDDDYYIITFDGETTDITIEINRNGKYEVTIEKEFMDYIFEDRHSNTCFNYLDWFKANEELKEVMNKILNKIGEEND